MSQFAQQRYPAVKFPVVGFKVGGKILFPPEDYPVKDFKTKQAKHWPDGRPIIGARVTIHTVDGPQTIWGQGRLLAAISKAISESSAPPGADLEPEGYLTVERIEDGEAKAGESAPHEFAATYEPPSESAAASDGPPF